MKDLNQSVLLDFYGQLLPERQREMMELYFDSDLSLAEIAEEVGISRQGVRDALKRGETRLAEFEEKLGLAKRFLDISEEIEKISDAAAALEDSEQCAELRQMLEKLSDKI